MLISHLSLLLLNSISLFKKHGVKLIYVLSVIYLWIFVSGDISSNDIMNYYWGYITASTAEISVDFGFHILERIGSTIGLSYRSFRMILSAISILLISSTVKKYSDQINFVLFFYFIYSIFMDTVQFRNFVAFSIIIYSIRFLVEKKGRYNFKFIIGVLIASSIHISNIVYLIFLIIPKINKIKIYFILFISLYLIAFFFLNNQINFIPKLLSLFSFEDPRTLNYFSTTANVGFLVPFVLHIFSTLIIKLSVNIVDKQLNDTNEYKDKAIGFIEFCYYMNLITISFFPLYLLNLEFMRLTRNLIIINLIANSIAFNALHKNKLNQSIYFTIVKLSILMWFFYESVINQHYNDVFLNLLNNNYFLN